MISRAGGVVKRMDDDWGRRTPGVAILRQQMGDAAHRESSTFPCIGDAVMPAAWPLAYCPPDAFALPAVGTQGMANRPSPEEGTQAFLRKARWWVSEANPDEVEVWRVAEEKTGRRGSMGMHRVRDRAAELHAYIFPLLKMVCGRSIIDVFLCWGSIWFRGQSEWIFMLCRGQMLWNAGDSGGMDAVWFRPAAQAAGCTGLAADDRRTTTPTTSTASTASIVPTVPTAPATPTDRR